MGNLSYQTMENDLQEYFSQAGVVTSVNLMLDRATGRSRGFVAELFEYCRIVEIETAGHWRRRGVRAGSALQEDQH